MLEGLAGASSYRHHGRRVVEGQRLMQATGDILLGWVTALGVDGRRRDFYLRQLWDAKASIDLETIEPAALGIYAELCGETLARAHARSGDAVAIASYMGAGPRLDRALVVFAEAYADQTERDHAALERGGVGPTARVEAQEDGLLGRSIRRVVTTSSRPWRSSPGRPLPAPAAPRSAGPSRRPGTRS